MAYEDWQNRKSGWLNSREGVELDRDLAGHANSLPRESQRVFGFDPSTQRPMPREALPGGATVPERTPIADNVAVRESGNIEPAGAPREPRYRPF